MKRFLYARKRRQLKFVVKKIRRQMASNGGLVGPKVQKWSIRLTKLVGELRQVLSGRVLKKIVGSAALCLGLFFTPNASAQHFAPPMKNPFGLDSIPEFGFPTFVDIDGDGDQDLIVGTYDDLNGTSYFDNNILFFENQGTQGTPQFADPVRDPFGLISTDYINVPNFTDLDSDGDQDLIVGNYYGRLQYFENTGTAIAPNFINPVENPFGIDSISFLAAPIFVDLDDDGDMDLLSGEYDGDYIGNFTFLQNTGTASAPQFATGVKNPFGLSATIEFNFPTVVDIDLDGDMDIFSGEYYGEIQYFENTGSATGPQFASPLLNPFDISDAPPYDLAFPTFADLDNDGDQDLMVQEYEGVFQYYENLTTNPVNVEEAKPAFEVTVFPNPTAGDLLLTTEKELRQVEIIDILGRKVSVLTVVNQRISIAHLQAGIYTLRVTDNDGHVVLKKIQKF